MPDLGQFHREIVFLHVIGVFLFLLAHGVSAGVMFWLRREREPAVLRSLLGLSYKAVLAMAVGALLLFVTGILAGFSGDSWTDGRLWLWVSLAVFVAVFLLMTPLARMPLDRIRKALDEPTSEPPTLGSAVEPGASASLEAAITATRPMLVAGLGVGAVIVLTWLMMYKPF
ncbi:MAG TPA: DUF2269 family protein [Candidatus Limnocylindria bacterium]|nr:DUF2269 family protein [Candidatus Limnocylindria bacterium]